MTKSGVRAEDDGELTRTVFTKGRKLYAIERVQDAEQLCRNARFEDQSCVVSESLSRSLSLSLSRSRSRREVDRSTNPLSNALVVVDYVRLRCHGRVHPQKPQETPGLCRILGRAV